MALINGGVGADILNGTGGGVVDTINGGAGDDIIQSVNAAPTDIAAWDADAAAAGAGDVLNGGDGNDTILGSAGSVIDGGAGNDSLDGLAGSRLTGGAGNDTIGGDVAVYTGNLADYAVTPSLSYIGNGLWASVYEVRDLRPGAPDGVDIVYANSIEFADGPYVPAAAPDSNTLFLATSHEETYPPETPADALPGTPNDVIDAHALLGTDVTASSFSIAGGADSAAFVIDPVTGILSFVNPPDFEAPTDVASITQGPGITPVVAGDNTYEVVIRVVDVNGVEDLVGLLVNVTDVAPGLAAAADGEVVVGTLENDTIDDGGFLNVTMNGLAGDDTFTTHGAAAVDGGLGMDTVELVRDAVSALFLDETAPGAVGISDGSVLNHIEVLTYTGSVDGDVVDASALTTVSVSLNGNEGNDNLYGGAADDVLIGGAGADLLNGGAGNDRLYADLVTGNGEPNTPVPGVIDRITGGAGNDVIEGDGGQTVVIFSGPLANYLLTVDALTGAVTVEDTTGVDGVDTVSGFGALQFFDVSLDANLQPIGGSNAAPVIDSNGGTPAVALTVDENGTLATTVHATDPDGDIVTYAIQGGADAALFQIDPVTGALTFKVAPNAEAPADAGANGVYDVIVRASDGTLFDSQSLAITVADVNEFAVTAPVDTNVGANHVAAAAAAGTLVGLTARATDADATNHAVSYTLAGFNAATSAYRIDATTGVVSVNNPAALGAPGSTQSVTVVATSSDGSSAQSTFSIVIDAGNSAPVIDSNGGGQTAAVTVNENSLAVTTVHATDANGNTVSYSISGGADAALFQINAATGALTFKTAPNAEAPTDVGANGVYDVVVQASDGTLVDTQAIAVTVADVNEFGVTSPTDTDAGVNHVASGAAAGTLVGLTVKATDADATSNAVSYSIVGFNAATSAFKIDATTGVVSVNSAAAITMPGGGSQTIAVQARSADGSTAQTSFTIAIDRVNAAPVIDSNGGGATAAVTVNENTLIAATVHATDANGDVVKYSIAGGADAALFQINATTGALTFKSAPNAEAPTDAGSNGVYDVIVQASDGTLVDTQAIAVTVADVNEYAVGPVTDANAAANSVAENLAAGALVGITAKATDADATQNAVTYSLSSNPGGLFAIHATTGVVTTTAALNHEAAAVYNLVVKATSADGSSSSQTFAVNVTNVNEAPTITSMAKVNVAENTTAVLKVTASDPDAGQALSYKISGGADASKFTIDAGTGQLNFKAAPDYEAPTDAGADNVYNLQVQVTDALGLSSVQDLTVQVTNVAGTNQTGLSWWFNTLNGGAEEDVLTGGLLWDTLCGNGGNDTLIGGGGADRLDGGAGIDTASYATASCGITADLSTGVGGGLLNDACGDVYVSIENLTGSGWNDTLVGNAGANALVGGAGNDTLRGNGGADQLVGGSGGDTFDFNALADSNAAGMDVIADFATGADKIDLRDIDASTKVTGNQAFSFIGTGAFTGAAGQLRYEVVQGHTYVYADTNGDKLADFQLDLVGSVALKAGDILL